MGCEPPAGDTHSGRGVEQPHLTRAKEIQLQCTLRFSPPVRGNCPEKLPRDSKAQASCSECKWDSGFWRLRPHFLPLQKLLRVHTPLSAQKRPSEVTRLHPWGVRETLEEPLGEVTSHGQLETNPGILRIPSAVDNSGSSSTAMGDVPTSGSRFRSSCLLVTDDSSMGLRT
ncbi:hypothetical protein H920_16987 [Fukomys damarensis]|uniref:Uncharacterized protein n=1 Tax=Fukomys damarensis TaxID=885580 RepID=A0A091CVA8_FUKDA|nr:hypothetical protein H920_16987 [Fukomys damarensis]